MCDDNNNDYVPSNMMIVMCLRSQSRKRNNIKETRWRRRRKAIKGKIV